MTTRPARRLTAAAGIAALALLISSCSSQDDPVAEPAPSSAAPTTSAPTTSSVVPVSAEDQAVAEATEAVSEFYAAVDRINMDRNSDPDTLHDVTTDDAYLVQVRAAVQMKARGLTQIGNARVVDATPFSIDLTTDATTNPPKYPTVIMDTCLDVSDVNVVDAEGKSAVSPTRPAQTTARLDLAHFDFGWRVTKIASTGEPCEL